MALIAPLLGYGLGVCFAWLATRELLRSAAAPYATRSLSLSVGFALLVLGPIVGFFLSAAPDWSFAYLARGASRPPGAELGVAFFAVLSVPLGYLSAARLLRLRRDAAVLPLMIAPWVISAAFLAAMATRLAHWGTTEQVRAGVGTVPLAGSLLGVAVLVMLCLFALGTWLTVYAISGLAAEHSTEARTATHKR